MGTRRPKGAATTFFEEYYPPVRSLELKRKSSELFHHFDSSLLTYSVQLKKPEVLAWQVFDIHRLVTN